jgi:MEMO1 family protein
MTHVLAAAVLLASLFPAQAAGPSVRPPAFAGAFYPADPAALAAEIDRALDAAEAPGDEPAGHLVGLIAPHAGYVYSGRTAAAAYARARGRKIATVVIVAPSHRAAFEGLAVWPEGGFRTPLGVARVDAALAKAIAKASGARFLPEAFAEEHAVEVQVPFIQRALPEAAIVPLVMGRQTGAAVRSLAAALAKTCLGKDVLVVASTDLSHFLPAAAAQKTDAGTAALIEGLKTETLIRKAEAGENVMCGGGGVAALLLFAEKAGRPRVRILARTDSSSFGGPVVGYLAAAVYAGAPVTATGPAVPAMDGADKAALLGLARAAVAEFLATGVEIEDRTGLARLAKPHGVFVTLTRKGELRGCIGFIDPIMPLGRAVIRAAVYAATEDPRFPRVGPDELAGLRFEISVLTPARGIDDPKTVRVGTHGLIVEQGGRRGVLLPQVAVDEGWDRSTFLDQVCLKAGLPPDAWRRGAKLSVFEAVVFRE